MLRADAGASGAARPAASARIVVAPVRELRRRGQAPREQPRWA